MKGKFPNNLKKAMAAKNMGFAELGRLIGEDRQQIHRVADGSIKLQMPLAEKAAPILGVKAQELFIFPGTTFVPRKVEGLDDLLRRAPKKLKIQARAIVEALLKTAS